MDKTTSAEVIQHFTSAGKLAKSELDWWANRDGYQHVADRVLAHVTEALYAIRPQNVPHLRTEHPLGDIKKVDAERVALIRDWFPDFAFTHIFHFMLEEENRLYRWQDFYEWCQQDRTVPLLWIPAKVKNREAQAAGFTYHEAYEAMRWRVGNFYYSFLREAHVINELRERGLPMRFHPLADALFRVDAWCENILLELYIGNNQYKAGSHGRKTGTQDYFSDQPHFHVVRFEMPVQRTFGNVHLPSPERIDQCASVIRQRLSS
ncbi:hypothetical protein [Nocardia sp. alder85J]|uniref:hypothetical protein n=1 Tax=Nocardia sp. alder85J TaxID=2862949 RepID=UPI001CD2CE46|nr:hypothetical protein [Nocardia sp. alder85J]MCX4093955.1 hypothetical protein [Nocardia sp. alder85J]